MNAKSYILFMHLTQYICLFKKHVSKIIYTIYLKINYRELRN